MGRLEDKVAIVTAGGAGIGRGIALAFGKEGARVVVAALGQDECDATVRAIQAAGGSATAIVTDVGHRDEVYAMVDATIARYGRLDVLVNVAQSFGSEHAPSPTPVPTPFATLDEDALEWTFTTGAMGTLWAMKAAFPHLTKPGGKVINFGSIFGVMGMAQHCAYAMTKEAIRAMSRTVAREWAPHGITVNVINPAARTGALNAAEETDAGAIEALEAQVPLGRFGDPECDIAPVAVFLASADSDYMTGQTIMADGGLYIGP